MTGLSGDYQKYLSANRLIDSGNLDAAWLMLNDFDSQELKESFITSALGEVEKMKDKIKNRGFYKGCDGNYHEYDDGYGSSNSGDGDDCCGGILGVIGIIICTIVCSIKVGGCCWCSACSEISQCLKWCHCC